MKVSEATFDAIVTYRDASSPIGRSIGRITSDVHRDRVAVEDAVGVSVGVRHIRELRPAVACPICALDTDGWYAENSEVLIEHLAERHPGVEPEPDPDPEDECGHGLCDRIVRDVTELTSETIGYRCRSCGECFMFDGRLD